MMMIFSQFIIGNYRKVLEFRHLCIAFNVLNINREQLINSEITVTKAQKSIDLD